MRERCERGVCEREKCGVQVVVRWRERCGVQMWVDCACAVVTPDGVRVRR